MDKKRQLKVQSFEEIVNVLKDESINEMLFKIANEVKIKEFGNVVFVRGIIEFSNYCRCKCAYCGINCNMKNTVRYRMTKQELILAGVAAAQVYQTIILQSGEDLYYSAQMIGEIVSEIKKHAKCAVTLSVGERTYDEYKCMKDAGADRFLIKHETADELLYQEFHEAPLSKRLRCQQDLKELGFELGGGFMVGLPKQTDEILSQDLLTLKRMDVDMAGIGPFIAHPDTTLWGYPDGDAKKTLKVLAIARILLPKCNLPSTTALNVKGGMDNALLCGANVIMQKATPYEYRKLYDIYPGRDARDVPLDVQYIELKQKLEKIGLVAK
ncbi:MAG: [FeFe] hydrogenase H-cluster radical SAM maturase HydE [Christensenellaceae bacterium]